MPVSAITTVTCVWNNVTIEAIMLVNNCFRVVKATYRDEMGGYYLEPVKMHWQLSRLSEKDKKEIHHLLIKEWNQYREPITIEQSCLFIDLRQ